MTHPSHPFLGEALCPVPLGLMPTTGTLSPWALRPLGDPVVVCQVRSTFRASVHPLPLLIAGCVLPEDHGDEAHISVRQESGFPRHSRRRSVTPTGTGVPAIQPDPCVASLANGSRPVTLGLTSLHPHAVVPSILSDEGQRIVLPAFFQRGRDSPDKTRQTFATAHRFGPTTPKLIGSRWLRSITPTRASFPSA